MRSTLLSLILCVGLSACSDSVSSFHTDLKSAKQDIDRGWIPPILPSSTHAISDTHNLDTNIGNGNFRFDPREIADFRLLGAQSVKLRPNPNSPQHKLQSEGFHFLKYKNEASSWTLAIHEDGRGFYWLENEK